MGVVVGEGYGLFVGRGGMEVVFVVVGLGGLVVFDWVFGGGILVGWVGLCFG